MFDGVHRGHAKVLAQLRGCGERLALPTTVVTFDPHPRAVVQPGACPGLLSSLSDRMQLLSETGAVDRCIVLRFDEERSRQHVDDFVRGTLLSQLGMRELVVGANFSCGHRRVGTVDYLAALGLRLGFGVTPVLLDAVPGSMEAVRSSSTEARRLIQLGDLVGASSLLQRPHEMTGRLTRAPGASHLPMEVSLPSAMCAPAEDDYVGLVRCSGPIAPWIPAVLQVREEPGTRQRIVRLLAEGRMQASPGEELRIRFVDRATGTRNSAAH
jgi:riboflavin kinase / FMN adenylyltransferase